MKCRIVIYKSASLLQIFYIQRNNKSQDFFLWTASLGKILTIDNLRKCGIIVADQCCTCRNNREFVEHFKLYCAVVRSLWKDLFGIVGLAWVMPKRFANLLESWKRLYSSPKIAAVWQFTPICLVLCIWRKINDKNFVYHEQTMDEFKVFFLNNMFHRAATINSNGLS